MHIQIPPPPVQWARSCRALRFLTRPAENAKERDLKNIRQIGNPTEDDKIYIENAAYARIHEEDYAQKRVFIFMGHTECSQGKYATFVEAAIPVRDLEFAQNIPK